MSPGLGDTTLHRLPPLETQKVSTIRASSQTTCHHLCPLCISHSRSPRWQGVRPKALERVTNRGLAEFILHCIQPLETRPKSRQLLKHHYFNSIRAERLTLKLGAEALGLPVPRENESHPDLQDYANSGGSSSVSRTSSAAGTSLLCPRVRAVDFNLRSSSVYCRCSAADHPPPCFWWVDSCSSIQVY